MIDNKLTNRAYSYNFKMMLEGVMCPFISASIACTPGGVEASIAMPPHAALLDVKPKTLVQLFYKDWFGGDSDRGWRLMFDGYFSRVDKSDGIDGARTITISCRDFRADIRKMPATLCFTPDGALDTNTFFKFYGMTGVVSSPTGPLSDTSGKSGEVSEYSQGEYNPNGILTINTMIDTIVGTATSKGSSGGESDAPFFLDAFARGIMMNAAGGTVFADHMNLRLRSDKKICIPENYAGEGMYKAQRNMETVSFESVMGNSMFTSIEAIIMKVAGTFMTRSYTVNSPSFIEIRKDSPARTVAIAPSVADFLTTGDGGKDYFGYPAILNETMLLPPLEFTAPPNCNLVFPSFYYKVDWQTDFDVDITRAYYSVDHFMKDPNGAFDLGFKELQFPNNLFSTIVDGKRNSSKYNGIPFTIEERYKGVNLQYDGVSKAIASLLMANNASRYIGSDKTSSELNAANKKANAKTKAVDKGNSTIDDASKAISDAEGTPTTKLPAPKPPKKQTMKRVGGDGKLVEIELSAKEITDISKTVIRHALIKFMNAKFVGRVCSVDMEFNPYIMCGFPGIVFADETPGNPTPGSQTFKTLKTLIGSVQQVRHMINSEGEAMTSMVMSHTRSIDESTDLNDSGFGLYLPKTNPELAEIEKDSYVYKNGGNNYLVPDGVSIIRKVESENENDSMIYEEVKDVDTKYAKDMTSVSSADLARGKRSDFYLDKKYEPNFISAFYRVMFGLKTHFMIGETTIAGSQPADDREIAFKFDSIHEAAEFLSNNRKDLFHDYDAAMNYVHRQVCTEDQFFCGILGATMKVTTDDQNAEVRYIVPAYISEISKPKEYAGFIDNESLNRMGRAAYFGISDVSFETHKTKLAGREIKSPGVFDSILSNRPCTAFIAERRIKAEDYIMAVKNVSHGVSFGSLS